MPIKELISLALVVFTGICVTHPMDAALAIRKVELSILREASDTRSWGVPVWFPETNSTRRVARVTAHREHLRVKSIRESIVALGQ